MEYMQQNNNEMAKANSNSPILEFVTYNLHELEDFGTPQDFFVELSKIYE